VASTTRRRKLVGSRVSPKCAMPIQVVTEAVGLVTGRYVLRYRKGWLTINGLAGPVRLMPVQCGTKRGTGKRID
jgi:hypothetical protein